MNSAVTTILALSMTMMLSLHSETAGNPKPGDVFRRIAYIPEGGPIPVCMPDATNEFSMFNDEKNHPAEVNWPGPILLIQFEK